MAQPGEVLIPDRGKVFFPYSTSFSFPLETTYSPLERSLRVLSLEG
jgi:hypothetical protein